MKSKFQVFKVIKSDTSNYHKELIGVELLVFCSKTGSWILERPLHIKDYDRYWNWLYRQAFKAHITNCESFEEYKANIKYEEEARSGYIFEENRSEFEYVRDYEDKNKKSFADYKKYFDLSDQDIEKYY